jgi:ApbE superfamily uncharacterized protein (UPF0280 family)
MIMPRDYIERFYRWETEAEGLVPFGVSYRESDLLVWAERDLAALAQEELVRLYRELEEFIARHPRFADSLVPYPVPQGAPALARDLAEAAEVFGVGPMAGVAGAFADHLGRLLQTESPEILLENGGDLYIASRSQRRVGIFAGASPLSGKLALRLPSCPGGMGLCTSSATVGPSLSLGRADAAVVLADSAVLSDAAATALGNRVRRPEDIEPALAYISASPAVLGGLVILGENLGASGLIEIC